ncbi:MAG: hypothetical protein BGO69_13860 [Bacteroidetes bacterium 46-16]|jgi:hypothetical protein|nr:MAG: hypothetical protein BGO69_13860 [Bacteroidetes bacterium 46-16]
MIRTIVKAEKTQIQLSVPEDYIGKQVEIIVFALDESTGTPLHLIKKEATFNAVSLNTVGYKFDRNEANER